MCGHFKERDYKPRGIHQAHNRALLLRNELFCPPKKDRNRHKGPNLSHDAVEKLSKHIIMDNWHIILGDIKGDNRVKRLKQAEAGAGLCHTQRANARGTGAL